MIHIPWKDRYNINYKDIDDQHKGLLGILNELADSQGQDVDAERIGDIFHRLCQYALIHFASEERYLVAAGYPDVARQQAEHASFISDLLELNQSYEPGDPRQVEATFTFVKNWYLNHIIHSDLDYVATLKSYHGRATIQGIIFDLSGVLCEVDEERFLEAAAPFCGHSADDLRVLIEGQPSLFRGYEAGYLDSQEFLAQFSALCGQEIGGKEFIQAYARVFTPKTPILDMVRRLKPRYKLGLIADTTPLRLEHGLENLGILDLFDAVTLPYAVKAAKLQPAVFRDITDKLGLMAEECLYVDDRPPCALAATGQLLHGMVASSAESLGANLRRMKIDI